MKGRRILAGIVGITMLTSAFSFGVFADNDEELGTNTSGQESTYQITNAINWSYTSIELEDGTEVTSAAAGTKVYVLVNMERDAVLGETGEQRGLVPVVHVTGADSTSIEVDDSEYRRYKFSFIMPDQDVTVTADFKLAIVPYKDGFTVKAFVNGEPAYCANQGDIVTVETAMVGNTNTTFYDYKVTTRDANNSNEHPIEITQEDGYFTFVMPDNFVIITAMPKIVGYQLTLNGAFELNFCVTLPEDVDAKDAYMLFEVGPQEAGEYIESRKNQVRLSEQAKDENGTYWVTCTVNPLELADTITATLYYGNNSYLTSNEVTALQYLNRVYQNASEEGDQELIDLVDALRDYAGILNRVNKVDGAWTDGRDHASFPPTSGLEQLFISQSGWSQLMERTSDVCDATEGYAITKDGEAADKIADVKLSLTLHSMNVINVYVKPAEGTQILSTPVDTVTINGETYYQFDSPYLKPTELGTPIAFEIETTSGTATVYASAISYVHVGIKNNLEKGKEDGMRFVKNVTLALFYEYYEAALAYQNTH